MELENVYHGHLVVSRFDESGWSHELFEVVKPRREGAGWAYDSRGPSLGPFPTLAASIKEAKRLNSEASTPAES